MPDNDWHYALDAEYVKVVREINKNLCSTKDFKWKPYLCY